MLEVIVLAEGEWRCEEEEKQKLQKGYNGRLWRSVMVVRLAGEEEVVEAGVAIAS